MQVLIADPRCTPLPPQDLTGMHQLRYAVFRERLNWDIPTQQAQERDSYDNANPVFVLVRGDGGRVVGCCRLLPTEGPYMLKDTFPQLLGDQAAPVAPDVWEISRFAVTKDARAGFGFTRIPAAMIRAAARFALANGIREYVFVTTVAFERLLVRMGVHLERLAPPQQVGIEKSVALRVFMDQQTVLATHADSDNDPFIGESSTREAA